MPGALPINATPGAPMPAPTKRVSKPGGEMAVAGPGATWEAIQHMIECTVCFDSIGGPIYQCSEGHLLCSLCWGRLYKPNAGCPTCSGVLGNIRCRFAESVRDAALSAEPSSPGGTMAGAAGRKPKEPPAASRHQAVKKAAEGIGVPMDDLRGIMAREGVGLMEAVILAARTRVKGHIEESGGVDGYEKKKREKSRAAVERAVAVAMSDAASPPRAKPSAPPCEAARQSQGVAQSPRRAAPARAVQPQEGSAGEQPAASRHESQRRDALVPGAASPPRAAGGGGVPRPSKKAETGPEALQAGAAPMSLEEKYARYQAEVRGKVDEIWREEDTTPKGLTLAEVPRAAPAARQAGAAAMARAAAASAASSPRRVADSGLEPGAGAKQVQARTREASVPRRKVAGKQSGCDEGARSSPKSSPDTDGCDAAARGLGGEAQGVDESRAMPARAAAGSGHSAGGGGARGADVMAAYASFRKEMQTKVLTSLRRSADSLSTAAAAAAAGTPGAAEEVAADTPRSSAGASTAGASTAGASDPGARAEPWPVDAEEGSQRALPPAAPLRAADAAQAAPLTVAEAALERTEQLLAQMEMEMGGAEPAAEEDAAAATAAEGTGPTLAAGAAHRAGATSHDGLPVGGGERGGEHACGSELQRASWGGGGAVAGRAAPVASVSGVLSKEMGDEASHRAPKCVAAQEHHSDDDASHRARSEAHTRSNSTNPDASPPPLLLPKMEAAPKTEAPPTQAAAAEGADEPEAPDQGQGASSLNKLRFPKIRTDLVELDSEHIAAAPHVHTHACTGVLAASADAGASRAGPMQTARAELVARPPGAAVSHAVAGGALVAQPPARSQDGARPAGSGASTARTLRVPARQPVAPSKTPRDAVRAVMEGDRSGAGVWKIVAGVRNRLRVGPGR